MKSLWVYPKANNGKTDCRGRSHLRVASICLRIFDPFKRPLKDNYTNNTIRRKFLDNLMTFRFAAAVLITLLLVVTNTVVFIKHYEQHLSDYDTTVKMNQRLQKTITYSAGEVYVDRPPNPLSIFNAGFDKQVGNSVPVSYMWVLMLDPWNLPMFPLPFIGTGALLIWSCRKLSTDAPTMLTQTELIFSASGLLMIVASILSVLEPPIKEVFVAARHTNIIPTLFLGKIRYNLGVLYLPVT